MERRRRRAKLLPLLARLRLEFVDWGLERYLRRIGYGQLPGVRGVCLGSWVPPLQARRDLRHAGRPVSAICRRWQCCGFRAGLGVEAQHVPEHQHAALASRQSLQRADERQLDRLTALIPRRRPRLAVRQPGEPVIRILRLEPVRIGHPRRHRNLKRRRRHRERAATGVPQHVQTPVSPIR